MCFVSSSPYININWMPTWRPTEERFSFYSCWSNQFLTVLLFMTAYYSNIVVNCKDTDSQNKFILKATGYGEVQIIWLLDKSIHLPLMLYHLWRQDTTHISLHPSCVHVDCWHIAEQLRQVEFSPAHSLIREFVFSMTKFRKKSYPCNFYRFRRKRRL